MTNGEKIQSMFPKMNFGTLAQNDVIVNKDYSNNDEPQVFIPIKVWKSEYKEKCTWIKYDYRTVCPKEHDADNPYWRIPENRMDALKYCPYCGKEIEVEE